MAAECDVFLYLVWVLAAGASGALRGVTCGGAMLVGATVVP